MKGKKYIILFLSVNGGDGYCWLWEDDASRKCHRLMTALDPVCSLKLSINSPV